MKVSIDCDRRKKSRGSDEYEGSWYCAEYVKRETEADYDAPRNIVLRADSYPQICRAARAAGHEIQCGGWRHKMLSWNWHAHSFDGYPEWEIERDRSPAFVKLTHVRRAGADVESSALANEWDDIATVDFYQRDWTDSGIPFVSDGTTYWSGWWFATIAERDRFVEWQRSRLQTVLQTARADVP